MATNFWTKIAINAYKCISTGDNASVTTYNRVFLWYVVVVQMFTFANSSVILPYARDKGALPWQPILGQKLL